MSRQDVDPINDAARDAYVVDSDFHVNLKIDDIYEYMDDSVAEGALKSGLETMLIPHWHPGAAIKDNSIGLTTQGQAKVGEDILEAMAEVGTDVPIVTPSFAGVANMQYPRIKNEICRAYNDYLLDKVTSVDEDVKGLALMPQWDPEAMVEELDRIGDENDVVGVYGWNSRWALVGHADYDPVFEKLVALDLPWMLHGSGGNQWPRLDPVGDGMRTWNEVWGVVTPCLAMIQATNMIMTGVFEKYPNLDMVIAEGGVTWLPFIANRLDEFYQDHPEDLQLGERMTDIGEVYLDRLPSEYLFENFYFATQPITLPKNPRNVAAMLDMCHAEETFLFSSDWPHHTYDAPNWVVETPGIDDELQDRIFHENAEAAFRL